MEGYFPLNFEKINNYSSTDLPSAYKSRNNKSYGYWMRALFERASYVLEFKLPDEWLGPQKDLMLYCLFKYGFGAVSYDSKFGYFFQPVQVSGYGFFYQPTEAVLSNPLLEKNMVIGKDCEIVRITHDWKGIWDIFDYYATKLSGLDGSLQTALINSKNSYMMFASNKAAAAALKKALDLINQGEPAVVFDSRALVKQNTTEQVDPIMTFDLNVEKNVEIISKLIEDVQMLLKQFDTEIGIQTCGGNLHKRMTQYESESNQQECLARCTEWVETLNECFVKVKKLYPELNLSVKINENAIYSDEEEKVEVNEDA